MSKLFPQVTKLCCQGKSDGANLGSYHSPTSLTATPNSNDGSEVQSQGNGSIPTATMSGSCLSLSNPPTHVLGSIIWSYLRQLPFHAAISIRNSSVPLRKSFELWRASVAEDLRRRQRNELSTPNRGQSSTFRQNITCQADS